MKYIIVDNKKYYVTLRGKEHDFKCHCCGRGHSFAALAKDNISNSFDSLICSKCGIDCGGGDMDFAAYLKRQKMSLKKIL